MIWFDPTEFPNRVYCINIYYNKLRVVPRGISRERGFWCQFSGSGGGSCVSQFRVDGHRRGRHSDRRDLGNPGAGQLMGKDKICQMVIIKIF